MISEHALNAEAVRRYQEEESESTDLKSLLLRAIRTELSEKQLAYLDAYYHGMKMREIAEVYNVRTSTISRTITRAENKLRKALRYADSRLLQGSFLKGKKGGRRKKRGHQESWIP